MVPRQQPLTSHLSERRVLLALLNDEEFLHEILSQSVLHHYPCDAGTPASLLGTFIQAGRPGTFITP